MGHVTAIAKAYCALAFIIIILTACSDDSHDSITLTSTAVVELGPTVNRQGTVSFHADANWTAVCVADWLKISQQKGEAGDHTITLTTTQTNRTKATRSAQLNITAGSTRKSVTIVQSGKYAVFDQDEYVIDADGGSLSISFTSNLESTDRLQIGYTQVDWISWADGARMTRADWTGTLPQINIKPNASTTGRTTAIALVMADSDGSWLGLDTCYIHQDGYRDDYTSTDYSADGTVTLVQQATAGNGIPVVIMGDGYADRDVADGTYHQVMEQAINNLFSEEPVKSLRHYFDVYTITTVSQNSGVGEAYHTALSTVASSTSSSISYDEKAVYRYLNRIKGLDTDNTLAIVILNGHMHNGVTYWFSDNEGQPIQFATALCPVIESLESETFRQVLTHEAIGHGLAKLADEYGYEVNGPITDSEAANISWLHQQGWLANIDTSSNEASVIWSSFIGDSRWQSEAIGVYEGGYTYTTGVYRSTYESMMNSNQSPFNAPSRKAIYDRIMLLGEGKEASTMDEFGAYDAEHKPERWDYSTPTTRSWPMLHRRLVSPAWQRKR